ncbi:MAG: hypothetical protein IT294_00265 [Deltaproteobacteria bacterium]|nr:hypothetical protein [Deltaproteobacteria bacterium]
MPTSPRERDMPAALTLLEAIRAGSSEPRQPPHWLAEVTAVMTHLEPATAIETAQFLHALDLPVLDEPEVYVEAYRLAVRLRHHVFDTLYHAVTRCEPEAVCGSSRERPSRRPGIRPPSFRWTVLAASRYPRRVRPNRGGPRPMVIRLHLARHLALCVVALLSPATARAADGDVLAWNRNNAWVVPIPIELFVGPVSFGGWDADAFAFRYPNAGDPKVVEVAVFSTGYPFGPSYTALGKASGGAGLKLKFKIADPVHGDGKLEVVMDPGLHLFTGTVKFGGPKRKGQFIGVYDRTLPGTPDNHDLSLRVAFTQKQKEKGLKYGGKATVLVALENTGTQAFPQGVQELRLAFTFAPGNGGMPFPVQILKILTIDGLRDFDFDLDPGEMAPLRTSLAVKDVLLLGVQFLVPSEAAGHDLTVIADLPPVDPGEPNPIVQTDQDTAPIVGLRLAVKLRNINDQNPIHIVLDDGRPASEQFTEENRITPGGSRTIKFGDLRVGDVLEFIAGRQGTILDTCSGTVLQSGKATVTWDAAQPPFLRLTCGG